MTSMLLTGSIQGFKEHLNSKSKENFPNIEVYGVFFINFYSGCFLRTKEIV